VTSSLVSSPGDQALRDVHRAAGVVLPTLNQCRLSQALQGDGVRDAECKAPTYRKGHQAAEDQDQHAGDMLQDKCAGRALVRG